MSWKHLPLGTLLNMGTVTIGSITGLYLHQVFPEALQSIIFQAIGLGVLVIGIQMSLKVPDGFLLIFIFSLILGGILGELAGLDRLFQQFGEWVKLSLGIGEKQFTEGLITAFLLFCIGSMTIVGAIEEGVSGKRELLLIKSTLDGITSIALASVYGTGVLFSILPMLVFQGGITILALQAKHLFTDMIIAQLGAVGGVLIIAVSINLLKLGAINVENLLPSLLIVVLLTWGYIRYQKA